MFLTMLILTSNDNEKYNTSLLLGRHGGVLSSTGLQVVWVQALAGIIVLCSWATLLTLTVPLFTQGFQICKANEGNLVMDWHPIQGRVEIIPIASCYIYRDQTSTLV